MQFTRNPALYGGNVPNKVILIDEISAPAAILR